MSIFVELQRSLISNNFHILVSDTQRNCLPKETAFHDHEYYKDGKFKSYISDNIQYRYTKIQLLLQQKKRLLSEDN